MKKIYLTAIFTCLIVFSLAINSQSVAQDTQCDSINNELTSKFRFLGEWNADGTPDYMDPASDEVSQALIDFVNETVPESVNFAKSHESYFGAHVQLNTELLEASKVYLTMVHEGAGWENTLGYYTYDINNPPQTVYDIDSLVILFPNVSQPNVIKPGDKVLLGEFPENTGIGYFLIAQGWVGDTICIASHIIFTHSYLNTFTSEEFRQQTILLSNEQEDKFLLGFEDIIRPGGDNDFNDAVFYITAEPGAIDTTDIPKIPTAMLSGDTTLCDINDPAIIQVDLSGQSPWTIVYNDGTEDIEISNIEESVFTFETTKKDTITLISVQDNNQLGIVDGKAVVKLSQPKAILDEEQVICMDSENAGGFLIDLEGTAPFSLTFKVGDEEKIIENISQNQIEITGVVGEKIELISMSDQYCNGEIIGGSATVQGQSIPSLLVDGSGALCGGALSTTLDLNLEGEGPWTLNYSLNDISTELIIESSEYQLEVSDIGVLTFNSIEDENCFSDIETTFNIDNSEIPTAAIEDMASICGEDEATVNISLTGEGPWIVQYEINGESMSADSDEELLVLNIAQSGVLELIGVADANCENTAEGNIEIEFYDIPTAFISGDTTLCQDSEAAIQIELTGIAPFTIVYTDGETETAVTSESTIYEFSSMEFKTYTLNSVDDANCSGTVDGSATISDGSDGIQVEIDAEETSCFGEDIELGLIGDTDNLTVAWSTEGNGTFSNIDQLTTSYSPGDGESGVVVFFAEVSNGCAVKTISKQVTIIDEIDASFDFSPDKNLLTNTQITFTPSNSDYDEYHWDFGDDNTSTATIASNEYIKGGLYIVELTSIISGCEGKGSAELEVLSKDELYVPNAFNPNAINSENQVVKVYGNNVDEFGFSFKIVNRWGKVMYETNSFNEANSVGWNGINKNNSEEQELNVFTYLLKGQFLEGDQFERTGTITQVK